VTRVQQSVPSATVAISALGSAEEQLVGCLARLCPRLGPPASPRPWHGSRAERANQEARRWNRTTALIKKKREGGSSGDEGQVGPAPPWPKCQDLTSYGRMADFNQELAGTLRAKTRVGGARQGSIWPPLNGRTRWSWHSVLLLSGPGPRPAGLVVRRPGLFRFVSFCSWHSGRFVILLLRRRRRSEQRGRELRRPPARDQAVPFSLMISCVLALRGKTSGGRAAV